MKMDLNKSSKMSSNSTIEIVQSLMQEAFESSYEKMDFLNDQAASKVASKDNDSSQSEFERLLSEGVENDSENIVDSLSSDTVDLLKKTTVELDKEIKLKSSKSEERMEIVNSPDNSADLTLTLDDSNASVEATKEDDKDTSTTESELNIQNSTQTTKDPLDNDSQERNIRKEMPNGIIQITNVVSQKDNAKSLLREANETNRNGNIADTVTTESLEDILESLDGPAEPEMIESEGNRNNNRQDSLLNLSAGDNDAAAPYSSASPSVEASSCQDVEIKIEVESEEEITYTETFCEEQIDRETDTHYFKMFECKGLTIDLHDIIKTESARDAKAGLYKPAERKCIDVIRKEYKTKAMQDYITRVKIMKLPEENYDKRSTYKSKNIPTPLYTPMVSINLSATKIAYTKNNTPKSKMNVSTTKKSHTKNNTPKSKMNSSTTTTNYNYKKKPNTPLTVLWQRNRSTKRKSSPKRSNKLQIKKISPKKMKVKFNFQKKSQQDYLEDSSNYDDNYDDDDDDDEDYEPSKTATNYVCFECREYFETQAELNVHRRMEHSDSSKYNSWNTAAKAVSKRKRATMPVKKRDTKPVYVESDSKKRRGILPVYFRSDQYRIDGINGMRKVRNFKPSRRIKNLNKEDMIQGANLVYNRNPFYNYELGKNITDLEMYNHMVKKYTIKAAKLCIGKKSFSSFYQLAKSPTDSLRAKITTVREERGHVLITSPLLHW